MLPVEGSSSSLSSQEVLNPLDSFFPFDPYLLNRWATLAVTSYGLEMDDSVQDCNIPY